MICNLSPHNRDFPRLLVLIRAILNADYLPHCTLHHSHPLTVSPTWTRTRSGSCKRTIANAKSLFRRHHRLPTSRTRPSPRPTSPTPVSAHAQPSCQSQHVSIEQVLRDHDHVTFDPIPLHRPSQNRAGNLMYGVAPPPPDPRSPCASTLVCRCRRRLDNSRERSWEGDAAAATPPSAGRDER